MSVYHLISSAGAPDVQATAVAEDRASGLARMVGGDTRWSSSKRPGRKTWRSLAQQSFRKTLLFHRKRLIDSIIILTEQQNISPEQAHENEAVAAATEQA
ncbi:hypothetical protein ON010_g12714 [Phytophthora cinnamomi]|nr:hypothetical protein ON010_g12714 [Phytophthora cinnamomi]